MKKRLATMVMAMVTVVSMCGAMRVEAAEITPDKFVKEDDPQQQPVVAIQAIHTQMLDGEEITTAYYVVTRDDETIMSIAYKLKVTEEYLLSVNPDYKWEVDEPLAKYAYIELPEIYWHDVECVYYLVGKGDTLSKISEYFQTDVKDIQELNSNIKDPDLIYAWDVIQIR